MKKFLKKIVLILSVSLVSIATIYTLTFIFGINHTGLAVEVFYVIDKAEHTSGMPAVILGDSVCNQLWPQQKDSPNISHLGCNQAITSAGTYLLLKKYLEHNPQTERVYYVILPRSLGNDLNLNFTYQYFVIPFINDESMKLLDEDTKQKLYSKFGKFFVRNKYVKSFLLNNNLFMKQYLKCVKSRPETIEPHRLSPTSIIYLLKMRELCRERNIELQVLPLPMADKPENYGWEKLAQDIRDNGLDDIFREFIVKMRYCPENWFGDGIHFKPKILDEHLEELRASVMD